MTTVTKHLALAFAALTLGGLGQAQTCTYEVTMVRSPEQVDADALREQFKRLGVTVTSSQFDSMVERRRSGFTGTKIVQYKREGSRLEGPHHSLDGVTLELLPSRFVVDQDAFVTYDGGDSSLGMVLVRKPEYYRSICPVYEERLLVGDGTLEERYRTVLASLALDVKDNPYKENARRTKEGFDVYLGNSLIYRAAFNRDQSTLSITKMVPNNFETITYRQIPNVELERFEDTIPIDATVSDYRLNSSFPVQYKWDGEVPPLSKVSKQKASRGDRTEFPVAMIASAAIAVAGSAFGITSFVKTRKKR